MSNLAKLVGQTLARVERHGDEAIYFICDSGDRLHLHHSQDCCETVEIEDISGDLDDLLGSPILVAEGRESEEPPPGSDRSDSDTWTFYTLRTVKGTVDIRWHGSSNGYYSERVDETWIPAEASP